MVVDQSMPGGNGLNTNHGIKLRKGNFNLNITKRFLAIESLLWSYPLKESVKAHHLRNVNKNEQTT